MERRFLLNVTTIRSTIVTCFALTKLMKILVVYEQQRAQQSRVLCANEGSRASWFKYEQPTCHQPHVASTNVGSFKLTFRLTECLKKKYDLFCITYLCIRICKYLCICSICASFISIRRKPEYLCKNSKSRYCLHYMTLYYRWRRCFAVCWVYTLQNYSQFQADLLLYRQLL